MTTADANLTIPVPWDKLLLWVQQQIALEMKTGQPVAMTRPQLEALSAFVPFNVEPDVSDQGYVSKLIGKVSRLQSDIRCFSNPSVWPTRSGRTKDLPVFPSTDTSNLFGVVSAPFNTMDPFHVKGLGSLPESKRHSSSRKSYLTQARPAAITPGKLLRMDRPAISPLQLPKPHIPPPLNVQPLGKRQRLSGNSPIPEATPSKSLRTSVPSTRSPSNPSVFEEVTSLSHRLALGSPTYKIEPDPAGDNLFCGRPVFKNDMRIPPDLGIVSGIASESQARLKVAESVLEWLQAELQRRQDTFESLWSAANSPKPATPNTQ
ncbi:hypothetical protein MHUMG1_06158 [Metarhizium humberi]|uniref:Uncharacterized protein n=1 Tax=Metarhizium humberi TaxID=2596975 RepID=A0A9P8S6X6_9HYPO|nr:hypothetical protein MHUMG1_06158 [Metarhizium humberi]